VLPGKQQLGKLFVHAKIVQNRNENVIGKMTKTVADLIIYFFAWQKSFQNIQKLTKNAINKREFIFLLKLLSFAVMPACIYILSNLLWLN